MFCRTDVLINFRKFTENTCVRASFLIKLQAEACNFIEKETLAQAFFCEFFKILKKTYFIEHLQNTASDSFIVVLQNYIM